MSKHPIPKKDAYKGRLIIKPLRFFIYTFFNPDIINAVSP